MEPSNKQFNLNQIFDRLTIGTVMILSVTILLLLILLILYSRLQNVYEDNNYELLAGIDELRETADDLQNALDTMVLLPHEDGNLLNELDTIGQQLDVIDETLEIIEENIEEIVSIEDEAGGIDGIPPSSLEIEDIYQKIHQIFFLITYLIGGLSIVTAFVLLAAVNSRTKSRHLLNYQSDAFP